MNPKHIARKQKPQCNRSPLELGTVVKIWVMQLYVLQAKREAIAKCT